MDGFALIEPTFFAGYQRIIANTKLEFESIRSLISQNSLKTEGKKLYTIDENGVAHANIKGVLRSKSSIFDEIFGVSGSLTYPEISEMADLVDSDPLVKEIILHIDSPGGYTMGVHDAYEAISLIQKPVTALVEGQCCSAAYWIASGANKIVAQGEQCQIGSIGTLVTITVYPEDITISSSDAPKKSPDPTTPEGKAVIQEMLDSLQSLFVRSVAEGRKVSVQTVQSDFGQGGVFLSRQALGAGMIDEIKTRAQSKTQTAPSVPSQPSNPLVNSAKTEQITPKGGKMDIEKLKTEHPAVFAEAVGLGAKSERERVAGLKSYADADKDNTKVQEIVSEAISNGSNLEDVQAKLLVAMRDFKSVNAPAVGTKVEDPASSKLQILGEQRFGEESKLEDALSKMFGGKVYDSNK